jgi:hypothetical protein
MKPSKVFLAVATFSLGGVLFLIAAPHGAQQDSLPSRQPAPAPAQAGQASSTTSANEQIATTTPTLGTPVAMPNMIVAATSTAVTVTVQITDPTLIPGSVNLLLLGGAGTEPTILGVMQSAGNSVYSLQPVFDESTTGELQLQVSAAFQGLLRRVTSPIVQVAVWGRLVDIRAGFSLLYPPSLYNLTDKYTPEDSFDLESSPTGVAIGGAVPQGSSVSSNGFSVGVSARPFTPSGNFDVNQYLSLTYPNSAANARITNTTISGQPGYSILFPGQEGGNWPMDIVYFSGYVYTILYSSTDYTTGFSDQAGFTYFENIIQHFTFVQ